MENDNSLEVAGTCLIACITADYKDLVKVFGEPTRDKEGLKTDVMWRLKTPYGVATIYNYKDGKNYLGNEGLGVENITDWHFGGGNVGAGYFAIGYFSRANE